MFKGILQCSEELITGKCSTLCAGKLITGRRRICIAHGVTVYPACRLNTDRIIM